MAATPPTMHSPVGRLPRLSHDLAEGRFTLGWGGSTESLHPRAVPEPIWHGAKEEAVVHGCGTLRTRLVLGGEP
jgi:hypothetical protein